MYLFISILSLILSIVFFRKAAGTIDIRKLNMISWIFWFSLVIQSFIASILIVYGVDNHYGVEKVYNEKSKLYGWMAVQYCMVMLPLSMWITLLITRQRKSNRNQWSVFVSKDIEPSVTTFDRPLRMMLYILGGLSILAVIYSFISVGKLPFQGFFSGGDVSRLRQEVTRGFGGVIYIKTILGSSMCPILSYIFYCYSRLYKEKIDILFFWLLFLSSVCIVSFDYAKSPLVFYLLGFFFLKNALGDHVNYLQLMRYSFLTICMIVGAYFLTGYEGGLYDLFSSYNSGFLGRLFLSQAFGTYLAFDLYPSVYEHIGFSSFTSIFGDARERMARELMIYTNARGVDEGVAGVINTLFIAEAWANWGIFGIMFGVMWVGILVQLIYSFFLYGKKTPIALGFYAYLCYKLPITGGMNDFVYNPGLFILSIIFILIILFVRIGVKSK